MNVVNASQFQTAVMTWQEQRAFVTNAVAALPPASPLARESRGRAQARLGPPLRRVARGRRVGQSQRQRVEDRAGPATLGLREAALQNAAVHGPVLRVDGPLPVTDVVARRRRV